MCAFVGTNKQYILFVVYLRAPIKDRDEVVGIGNRLDVLGSKLVATRVLFCAQKGKRLSLDQLNFYSIITGCFPYGR